MTALTATEPYTCRDGECRDREAAGKRCPWCWGGFPSTGAAVAPERTPAELAAIDAESVRLFQPCGCPRGRRCDGHPVDVR